MIDFKAQGKPLPHFWSECVGAGRANEGLRADWQEQLKLAHDACGFRYIRFHGLLHDDMHVVKREADGLHYNFQYIDKLYDFLLDTGVRPIVEFSFMPVDLSSGEETVFWWKSRITPPADPEEWKDLIRNLVQHWKDRYGINEIRKWYYEVWNEPDLDGFWAGTRSQYFELYRITVQAVKSVDPELRVGGPATSNFVPDERYDGEREDVTKQRTHFVEDLNTLKWHGVWIEAFLKFCEKEKLPVDFVSTHPYPTDFALDKDGHVSGRSRHKSAVRDDMEWLADIVSKSAYPDAEIHLTEWSSSPSSRDYTHDYLTEATYIMKTAVECTGLANSLSYWTFTDVFEEMGAGPACFHGGFGIITLQGVKKPAFHAYRMLNELGNVELARTDGSLVTRKKDGLAAVFYNYPESYLNAPPISYYPDQSKAVDCQNTGEEKTFTAEICNLPPHAAFTLEMLCAEDIAINRWNEMGRPESLTREIENDLRAQGNVTRTLAFEADEKGVLKAEFTLAPWSVAALTMD